MGGLSPEFLQNVQRGVGGLGQGALLGQQAKRQDVQRQEDIGIQAAAGGFGPAQPGQTPAFSAGGKGFVQTSSPFSPRTGWPSSSKTLTAMPNVGA